LAGRTQRGGAERPTAETSIGGLGLGDEPAGSAIGHDAEARLGVQVAPGEPVARRIGHATRALEEGDDAARIVEERGQLAEGAGATIGKAADVGRLGHGALARDGARAAAGTYQ